MTQFELFCMIFYVLDADWDDTRDSVVGEYLSSANPFLFSDIGSADPSVYKHFCEVINEEITVGNSYSLACKYIGDLNTDNLTKAFYSISRNDWDEILSRRFPMNMIIDTDLGTITVTLFPKMAPAAIKRLGEVIDLGLMKDIALERLEPGFIIQPLFFDGVNAEIDVMVEPEFKTVPANHDYRFRRGTVAMAGDADHASGCQFFISLAATERLNGNFTVIGEVADGSDVVDAIDALPVVAEVDAPSGFTYHRPEKTFMIRSVRIE